MQEGPSKIRGGTFIRARSYDRRQAVFHNSPLGSVAVANLHIVSGSAKNKPKERPESHEVPGNSPEAKRNFKCDAVMNSMMAVDELMTDHGGKWFLVGDLNLLSSHVDHFMREFVGVKMATSVMSICNKMAKPDMQRDWFLSPVRCELVPMKHLKTRAGLPTTVSDRDEHDAAPNWCRRTRPTRWW